MAIYALYANINLQAQRTISGTVTGNSGVHLVGATVYAKGFNAGTNTDINGMYTIAVPEEVEYLLFSYIGYVTSEAFIGEQNLIDFMADFDPRFPNGAESFWSNPVPRAYAIEIKLKL